MSVQGEVKVGTVLALANALLAKGADSKEGEVAGVLLDVPSMLDTLLLELVLLKGGGARNEGDAAPDKRLVAEPVLTEVLLLVLRYGRVAARPRSKPTFLLLVLPDPLAPPPVAAYPIYPYLEAE